MVKITLYNTVEKGYHKYQISPPPSQSLPVTKEYGHKPDPKACLVLVPELQSIPQAMQNEVSDAKQDEIVKHIAS